MSGGMRRVEKLETGLTPKQAILLWLQEAHAFNTIEAYVRHLKTQPDSAWPIDKLTTQVEETVKQTLKGKPREQGGVPIPQAQSDLEGASARRNRQGGVPGPQGRFISVLSAPASQWQAPLRGPILLDSGDAADQGPEIPAKGTGA